MKKVKGFTLIELMIVVAIIGIIAAFAVTSYNDSVRKTKRADAKASLLDIASRFERCFSMNGQYTTTAAPARNCALVDVAGALTAGNAISQKQHYTIALTNGGVTPTSFELTATPAGFVDAECTTFVLNNLGQRTATGGVGNTGPGCW